jgi:hypothetical protein
MRDLSQEVTKTPLPAKKAVEAGMDFQAVKRGRTLGERRKKED